MISSHFPIFPTSRLEPAFGLELLGILGEKNSHEVIPLDTVGLAFHIPCLTYSSIAFHTIYFFLVYYFFIINHMPTNAIAPTSVYFDPSFLK